MTVLIKQEGFFDHCKSAHKVSKAKADLICRLLNNANYQLKDGQKWVKQEISEYDYKIFPYAEVQAFKMFKGQLKEVQY